MDGRGDEAINVEGNLRVEEEVDKAENAWWWKAKVKEHGGEILGVHPIVGFFLIQHESKSSRVRHLGIVHDTFD
ncbi:hypothetical protein [Absidia glauca]|uniref:Uncharacterized protein n=1 Tax=Absidia glauca TaxID=4829 RepID=A0A168N9J7_ABSGL|nr:hypothetical protein [Absidia glauca]